MKKILLLSVSFLSLCGAFSQVLFTYGDNAVTKDEFLRAYNKNNTGNEKNEKSLREYLELYSKFKLKVKAAQSIQLDTVGQLQSDLQNFRSQIEDGYMNDEHEIQKLVDEAFVRSQKDIRVSHLYIPLNDFVTIQDSIAAYSAITDFYKEISKGNKDYKTIAADLTMKYKMVVKSANIGFVTAFSVPYEYENIIYSLKPGSFNKPYRSKYAWHIFVNEGERRPFGKCKAAQILFLLPPNASEDQKQKIQQKADSVYSKLISGADFSEMAKKISEDRMSYQNGGEMKEFGAGKYTPAFEDKVAELKNDGDISKPFFTGEGFHIVKRIQQIPVPSNKENETYMNNVKQQVLNDSRLNVAKQKFIKDVLQKIAFEKNKAIPEWKLLTYADSVVSISTSIPTPYDSADIFSFGKTHIIKGYEWYNFVKEKRQPLSPKSEPNEDLYDNFITEKALDFYKKHLEEYNGDFKYQVQEFRDGNMLFEIMERKVWTKASGDSTGLVKQYQQNKPRYLWNASADVVIFNCSNKDVAEKAIRELKEGKAWVSISSESNATVQADSGRYELKQLQIPADAKLTEKYISPVSLNEQDKTANFVQILKLYPSGQQRSFEEAKGLVINDYQTYLEEKWIEELKTKYPVKVDEKVFKSLLR